ncbi:hypothetical protein C8R43DRAFT_43319 [Mycena crocata]|nr:hypothetical protein C8R43DRAFT_43319 [Mycena crocata]
MPHTCWNCGAAQLSEAELCHTSQETSLPVIYLTPYLLTNDPLPEPEIPAIRQIIVDNELQLGVLEAQISSISAALDQLRKRRDALAEVTHQYRGAISVVRRVPAELVCEIFAFTMQDVLHTDVNSIPPSYEPTQSPWSLASICASWRRAALGYPMLWRFISLSPRWIENRHTHPSCSELKTQLIRSGDAPLQVVIHWLGFPAYPRLLELLLPHCNRWNTLHIYIHDHHKSLLDGIQAAQGHLNLLQKLHLVISHFPDEPEEVDIFSSAPRLREVCLTDTNYVARSFPFALPWGQIIRYRGSYYSEVQLPIIQAAPCLVECGIGSNLFGETKIILPHLRRLYVRALSSLSRLTAPLLQELFSMTDCEEEVLCDFVSRSSCALTKLVLGSIPGVDILIPMLRVLPFLEHLHLGDNYYCHGDDDKDGRLFDAIRGSDHPSSICPRLAYFGYYVQREWPYDQLFAMVVSRLPSTESMRGLECLRLFVTYYSFPLEDEINKLKDLGLDAEIVQERSIMWEGRP